MRYESDYEPSSDRFPLILLFAFVFVLAFFINGGGQSRAIEQPAAPSATMSTASSTLESTATTVISTDASEVFGRSKKNANTAVSDELGHMRSDLRTIEQKIKQLEKLMDELTADSYPTVDQQVAMRRDIDRIFVNEIPLMRQSILELNVRQVELTKQQLRITWFDAHDSLLNHTNDLLLQFAESDVVCLYNARIPIARFDERCRTPDSVDVFKPVLNYRLQYMILAIMRVEKDEAIVSGIALSPSLNATFPCDESIEQDIEFARKYVRLEQKTDDQSNDDGRRCLTLRCVLNDANDCCLSMAYTLDNEYTDQVDDPSLLERVVERARGDFAEEKTAGRTQGDRLNLLVVGDVGCTLDTFRRELVPKLTNAVRLKSEFEYCLTAPLITDHRTDKHFRHNVHALSNNRIASFRVCQVSKTRIAVEVIFTLDRSPTLDASAVLTADRNRKGARRTLHGRMIV